MPLIYAAPQTGALRQGELIGPIWINRVRAPSWEITEGEEAPISSFRYAYMVVLHADCDLAQDFDYRRAANPIDEMHQQVVPEALVCAAFEEADIRARMPGSDVWKRVRANQDERYHHIGAAPVADSVVALPDLYLDFKRSYMEPTGSIYAAIETGNVKRICAVPAVYVHDLMHRFFGFHSRVGLPD